MLVIILSTSRQIDLSSTAKIEHKNIKTLIKHLFLICYMLMCNLNLYNCCGSVMATPIYPCLSLCTPTLHSEAAIVVAFWISCPFVGAVFKRKMSFVQPLGFEPEHINKGKA